MPDNKDMVISKLRGTVSNQVGTITNQADEIRLLKQQLDWFRKYQFGGGKGEKTDANQLELEMFKKNESGHEPEKSAQLIDISPHQRKKKSNKRRTREELFENLPARESEKVVIIPDEVKADPDKYQQIGEEVTFEIVVTPPEFFKREIVRNKYKLKDNKELPPVIAPAPERLIEGSYVSIELIVYIIIGKFIDHLPLYRQEQIFLRYGLNLSRKLMSDWIGKIAIDWLKPIYSYMLKELRKCNYLQLDETLARYINGKIRVGKTQQGYFWVVSRPGGDVVFLWSTSRSNKNVIDMLGENYEGIIQTDGYATYSSYANTRANVTHAGCWAHLRRKFVDAQAESPLICRWLIRLIGILFANEVRYRKQSLPPKEIECRRQSESAMTIKLIKRILDYSRDRELPQGKFGTAIRYGLNQWPELIEYLNHGEVQVSNNLVENAIRPIALGRKNCLFIGHQDAGENAAIIYSMLGSCKRHGIDPAEYLRDTLTRMLNAKVRDDGFYAGLTPEAFKNRYAKIAV